ncbi:MAG: DNA-binding protein WhiA [Synergistaceae bacterium]|jgi:DNA-binding transcriptional regulator WhiA|nr:DNA-binding protein WhiA [Synergistaceae bacterium]
MPEIKNVIWDEFIGLPTKAPRAELSGFLEALPKSGGQGTASFACPSPVVGRRLLKLWNSLNERSFSGKITARGRPIELNRKLGRAFFVLPEGILRDIVAGAAHESGSERWAWFRGLWGGCGALYLPQSGYYMTLRPHGEAPGRKATALLSAEGIALRKRVVRGRAEYMLRDQERIVTCLLRMGLVKSSLLLEETAIVRSIKNRVNKVINCDSANISKTVDAAAAQLAMVDTVDSCGLWDHLTPAMAELAYMRRLNPGASLAELGQMLSKPVSKSTVEYRWRKLKTLLAALGR